MVLYYYYQLFINRLEIIWKLLWKIVLFFLSIYNDKTIEATKCSNKKLKQNCRSKEQSLRIRKKGKKGMKKKNRPLTRYDQLIIFLGKKTVTKQLEKVITNKNYIKYVMLIKNKALQSNNTLIKLNYNWKELNFFKRQW